MPQPLPADIEPLVRTLRQATGQTPDSLRSAVNAHVSAARMAASASPFVDLDRAEQVGKACLGLLDAWPTLDAEARSWVQAACLYFASEADSEDDFDSIVGFDDDADVVSHVAHRVGLPHLTSALD